MNSETLTSKAPRTLALVGAGYWGKNLARNFHALGALHTLCDSVEATLESYDAEYAAVAKTPFFEDVLADHTVRELAIAAPAALHYELAKAALLAGKDVYVEKPLCLEVSQGEELVSLAEKAGLVLMVGHLLQYHPCIRRLQSLLAEGELGKLHYITSNRLNLGKIRREENALWSFAPHDISVILSLVGDQVPERLVCTGESYLTNGVADTTLTAMRFAGGVRAHVFVSWLNPFKEQKLTVVGSNGMAVFDDTRPWNEKLLLHRHYLTWANGQIPTPNKSKGEPVPVAESEPLRNECAHFLECCQERRKPRTDGREGLRVLQVLQAAQQSLENDGKACFPHLSSNGNAQPGPLLAPSILKLTVTAGQPEEEPPTTDYFVHPTAIVDEGARIGKGSRIWHFSHVMKGATIGEQCVLGQNVNVAGGAVLGNNVKVQNNVSIYDGLLIEDDVFLGPSCVLTNVTNPRAQVNRHQLYESTVIKRGATVGANATILCGVTLGRYCLIAAGAVVTKDVPDYTLMVGNPARPRGWISRHGHVLHSPDRDGIMLCPESGLRYRLNAEGCLCCLDLPEDTPLAPEQATGTIAYRNLKSLARTKSADEVAS